MIILIYGSGGHNEQMKRVYSGFLKKGMNEHNFVSLIEGDTKNILTTKFHKVPALSDKRSKLKAIIKLPYSLFKNVLIAILIVKRYDFKYVVSTGPGISIISSLIFKLFKKKVIFIETWSRFESKSISGKYMYHIADFFFIQTPELKKYYKNSTYLGRL